MSKSPHDEVLAAHMVATQAAFTILVRLLQNSGVIERGEFPEALHMHMERERDRADPMTLAMLNDLRLGLLD